MAAFLRAGNCSGQRVLFRVLFCPIFKFAVSLHFSCKISGQIHSILLKGGERLTEDSQIIALFFARAEAAIAALSEKYGADCRRIAANILKNTLDAEECVSDAYLAAWNTIPPQKPDPLRAYLLRIVRNIAITRYHANTAEKRNSYYDAALAELEGCLASSDTVEEAIDADELSHQIDRFLAALDKESRMLFVRRYWYADSIEALAARFHLQKNAVSVRLWRIREKLKIHLRKEGYSI